MLCSITYAISVDSFPNFVCKDVIMIAALPQFVKRKEGTQEGKLKVENWKLAEGSCEKNSQPHRRTDSSSGGALLRMTRFVDFGNLQVVSS